MKKLSSYSKVWNGWELSPKEKFDLCNVAFTETPLLDLMETYAGCELDAICSTGNAFMALCPVHRESHRSMRVTHSHCRCYACMDEDGMSKMEVIQLLMSRMFKRQFSENDVLLQFALDADIISLKDFESMAEFEYKAPTYTPNPERYGRTDVRKLNEHDLEMRTDIYEAMFTAYRAYHKGLLPEDLDHLTGDRHVRDLSLYCSIDGTKAEHDYVLRYLDECIPREELIAHPGFWAKKNALTGHYELDMLRVGRGIGIQICDARGYIRAVQIRSQAERDGSKYYFFSSAKNGSTRGDRIYIGGDSVGTPVNVIYPDKIDVDTSVAIVEGHFKGEILAQKGYIALCVQGVHNYREIPSELKFVEEKIGRHINKVYVFYDADILKNIAVFNAFTKLSQMLKNVRPDIAQSVGVWDYLLGKGIDDLYFAGYEDTLRFLPADEILRRETEIEKNILRKIGVAQMVMMTQEQLAIAKELLQQELRKAFIIEESYNPFA